MKRARLKRNEKTAEIIPSHGVRDLLALVRMGDRSSADAAYAISLAKFCGAHLTVLTLPDNGSRYESLRNAPSSAIEKIRSEDRQAAQNIRKRIGAIATTANVPVEIQIGNPFGEVDSNKLGLYARHFDVTILASPVDDAGEEGSAIVEAVTEQSGRAVLVVPHEFSGTAAFSKIMLVWDHSRASARALAESLPLLARADRIEVVTIPETESVNLLATPLNVLQHLARHQIVGEMRKLTTGPDIPHLLLDHAKSANIDLIVMGAFGFSRFPEPVGAEVTRNVVRKSSTPLLLAH